VRCISLGLLIVLLPVCACSAAKPAGLATAASSPLVEGTLLLPSVSPGSACPVTPGHPADTFSPFGNGYAAGTEPVYALLGGTSNGVVGFSGPVGGWYGGKVLWMLAPSVGSEVRVRGRQIDGQGPLGFDNVVPPSPELRVEPSPTISGWTGQPSTVRVQHSGCYAFQVDGLHVSEVIVFAAQVG
jgi:hypothetical protein